MDLIFENNRLLNQDETLSDIGKMMVLSKAADITERDFDNFVRVIDESGHEISCTADKFIEIFDEYGLEGFIL